MTALGFFVTLSFAITVVMFIVAWRERAYAAELARVRDELRDELERARWLLGVSPVPLPPAVSTVELPRAVVRRARWWRHIAGGYKP